MCSRFRTSWALGSSGLGLAWRAARRSSHSGEAVAAPSPPGTVQGVIDSALAPGVGHTLVTIDPRAAAYYDNADAVNTGKRLFGQYNCSGCHSNGGGGMGPSLMDDEWIYGGRLEQIHQTLVEGRPNGMPAWGGKIPDEQLWQISAYVRSMSLPQTLQAKRHDAVAESRAGAAVRGAGYGLGATSGYDQRLRRDMTGPESMRLEHARNARLGRWRGSVALALAECSRARLPAAAAPRHELVVCADPNNLPFSSRDGSGFENKFAELVARRHGRTTALRLVGAAARIRSEHADGGQV